MYFPPFPQQYLPHTSWLWGYNRPRDDALPTLIHGREVIQSADVANLHLWLPQEAERSLHAARQHLQDIEDARSSAEEKVACLEAALQQSVSRLAEVRSASSLLCVTLQHHDRPPMSPRIVRVARGIILLNGMHSENPLLQLIGITHVSQIVAKGAQP